MLQGRMGTAPIVVLGLQEDEPYLKVPFLAGYCRHKDSPPRPFAGQVYPDQEEGGLHPHELQVQLVEQVYKSYLLLFLKSGVLDFYEEHHFFSAVLPYSKRCHSYPSPQTRALQEAGGPPPLSRYARPLCPFQESVRPSYGDQKSLISLIA